MKKLLVAIDFSEQSKQALHYAAQLSAILHAEIEIMHSFISIPAIGIDGGPDMVSKTIIEEGTKATIEKLEKWRNEVLIKSDGKRSITVRVSVGDPVFQICDHAAAIGADMIIMGTVGESKIETLLFGSTTLAVMRHSQCPVLAIPKGAVFKPFNTIVYGSGLGKHDMLAIKKITGIATVFQAEIIVFHAFEEDAPVNRQDAAEFAQQMKESVGYHRLRQDSVTYENSRDAILNEVRKTHADLMVMRERRRGIFDRLFHQDLVKQINDHTRIPLLIFNDRTLEA